ncbi:hypothetical protein CYLTODRAFT_78512 [Cylindrobasidium torrendii FP15055 ss-10]|uniref:Uncharacterized protein n=1 Tax=Cylindrobasidium torrendii FP15055 ss-10 TaxID=1314674 RepID=A0A0D7BP24_9AGAR|nr:hypothetical protein CYLTODRAFT_78512 [Cylindrobasidium torrendii FP15055 ss-10]
MLLWYSLIAIMSILFASYHKLYLLGSRVLKCPGRLVSRTLVERCKRKSMPLCKSSHRASPVDASGLKAALANNMTYYNHGAFSTGLTGRNAWSRPHWDRSHTNALAIYCFLLTREQVVYLHRHNATSHGLWSALHRPHRASHQPLHFTRSQKSHMNIFSHYNR